MNPAIVRSFVWGVLIWLAYILGNAIWHADYTLIDTDSYTRLIKVERWMTQGLWSSNSLVHMNAPYGVPSFTWTKLVDFTLLITALPLMLFFSFHDALYWGSLLNGPIFLMGSMLMLAWGLEKMGSYRAAITAGLVLLANPIIQNYANPFHVDHHMAQVFFLCSAIAFLIRHPSSAWLGIVCALGVWVSSEFFLAIAWVFSVLWWRWIKNPQDTGFDIRNAANIFFLTSLVVLPIERGADLISPYDADRFSLLYVMIAGFNALFTNLVARAHYRLKELILVGCISMLFLCLIIYFTDFSQDVVLGASLFYKQVSRDPITEITPMFGDGLVRWGNVLFYMLPFISLWPFYRVWHAHQNRSTCREMALGFVPLIWVSFFVMLRSNIYLAPFIAVISGFYVALIQGEDHKQKMKAMRTMCRFFVGLIVFFGSLVWSYPRIYAWATNKPVAVENPKNETSESFYLLGYQGFHSPLVELLQQVPPSIIWALDSMDAAALPWYTHHRVVSAPYHGIPGALADYRTLITTTNQEEAAALCHKRGVHFVLFNAVGISAEQVQETLRGLLLEGLHPFWLKPVELPEGVDNRYKLYEVLPPTTVNHERVVSEAEK